MYEKQHFSDIFAKLLGFYLNKIIFLISEMDPTNFIVNWYMVLRIIFGSNQLCVGFNNKHKCLLQ